MKHATWRVATTCTVLNDTRHVVRAISEFFPFIFFSATATDDDGQQKMNDEQGLETHASGVPGMFF